MKTLVVMLSGLLFFFIAGTPLGAQSPVPPPGSAGPAFDSAQLDQLVGPIALYPDPLIAEILPAATFPSQIVMADRFVSEGGDPNQIPDQDWDPSVQALAHYPNVLKWMDDNLAWTTQLGQAFESQQADVMNTIQQLRAQAQNLGNLPSTPQESVLSDDNGIEIEPTDPDQMYVPSYQPGLIYYQPGYYCAFPFWLPLGVWIVHDLNWHSHGLIFWGPGHPRPGDWWRSTPAQRRSYVVAHPPSAWRAGRGAAAARGGWERGYETPRASRSFAAPAAPRKPAPAVTVIHSAPTTFRSVPAFSGNAVRSAPSTGLFTGGQTGHEAVESSSRGHASRAEIGGGSAPRSSGGGGSHGGGGGGGGGGHGSGGGGHR